MISLQERIASQINQPDLDAQHLEDRQDENAIYHAVTETSKRLRAAACATAEAHMELNEAREAYESAMAKQALYDATRAKDEDHAH